jgi:hypothetical protein
VELGAGLLKNPHRAVRCLTTSRHRPLIRNVRWFGGLVAAISVLSYAAACGTAPTPIPEATAEPTPSPEAVIDLAVLNLLELKSAAFTLEHQTGSTMLLPGLVMKKATGVVDIPDRLKLTVEAEVAVPRTFVEINVITIGEQAYMTDFFSRQWRTVPLASLPVNFMDFGQTLASIIEAVGRPSFSGVEEIEGRRYQRVTGSVPSEALAALVPGAAEGLEVELELWLDREAALLRRVLITGPVLAGDIPETVRMLSIDDVNVPVDIAPPE